MIWENETDTQETRGEASGTPDEHTESAEKAGQELQADLNQEEEHAPEDSGDKTGEQKEKDAPEDTQASPCTDREEQDQEEAAEPESESGSRDKKDEQIADLKDRLMRQMAEFDNYRKRTEKEKAQNYEIGETDFLVKLLPVVDNFERGMDAMTEEDKASSFGQGMEMIYKQLTKLLEDEGVKEIEALGKEFDPGFHNAVMQQPSEEYESGTVMQVLQKGYLFKEKVLRHSMVMVAQ